MRDGATTTYDRVRYKSFPYFHTHPDRLAIIAHLMHLRPAPAERCRYLELGCSSGGNLLPMAMALPGSRFVGVDLAGVEIAEGRETIRATGLSNCELLHADLGALEDLGTFDYIVAHGVYSWIPDPVKERLLALCGRALAPHGVAYISHNVKPGWYQRDLARRMMLYHSGNVDDPQRRMDQGRALMQFLVESATRARSAYRDVLQEELENIRRQPDWCFFHDYLGEVNDGCFFYEMVERGAAHGLQFLADANFSIMFPRNLSRAAMETLDRVAPDVLRTEQYHDFLTGRAFRRTLFVRQDVEIDRNLKVNRVEGLYVMSRATPRLASDPDAPTEIDPTEPGETSFGTVHGDIAVITEPITKAALLCLREVAPLSMSLEELAFRARARLGAGDAAGDVRTLASDFLQCFAADIVELSLSPPRFTQEIADAPLVTPLVRLQAETDLEEVTNQRHESVRVDAPRAFLLSLLDGTRGHDALLEIMRQAVSEKKIALTDPDWAPIEPLDRALELLPRTLQAYLVRVSRSALLVGGG